MTILIGADPEVFIEENNQIISAHNLIQGTKRNPYPVPGGSIQVDGTAAEFNINPVTNGQAFVSQINKVMRELKKELKLSNPLVNIHISPSVFFDNEYFNSLPYRTKVLGCEPDWSAYSMERKTPPQEGMNINMRTGSGHIHIGFIDNPDNHWQDPKNDKFEHVEFCGRLTRKLDDTVLYYQHLWDNDNTREELYGERGSFRPKKYGMEYRCLSNMWLKYPKLQLHMINAIIELTQNELENRQQTKRYLKFKDYVEGEDFFQ